MACERALGWKQDRFKGWECHLLRKGPLELVLVPQIGGRIMGCMWRGQQLFFTQPEREGHVEDVASVKDVAARKREMGMPLWGGDKTWLAPQSRWNDAVPFLDLDSGPFEPQVRDSSPNRLIVEMNSGVCRETGIQITRTVTISAGAPGWSVQHRLTNHSGTEAEWGVWDVSMVLRPGKVYMPRSGSSPHPRGVKTYAEEGESVTARESVVSELEALAVIECFEPKQFKYGVDSREGWVLGVLEAGSGLIGYRKSVPSYRQGSYAHGCVCEVYNSADYPYLEMENHGPLTRMKPGETFEMTEQHEVFDVPHWPQDEAEVRQYLNPPEEGD
jgi:hypothetical protein